MRLITASFKSLLETVSSKSLTKFETGKWWYIYEEKAKTKTTNNKQYTKQQFGICIPNHIIISTWQVLEQIKDTTETVKPQNQMNTDI